MPLNFYSVSEHPAIYYDGFYRVLSCIPSSEESASKFSTFQSAFRNISAADFQEIDLSYLKPPIKDQKATSACVGFSTSSGMDSVWMQMGRELELCFSPFFTYGIINGNRDAGAMISDALRSLMENGICRVGDLPAGAMFQRQFPQSAFEIAKKYKLKEAFRCQSFEDICAAISLGFFVAFGIMVGSNFPALDRESVAPLPNGRGGGHALLGVGLKRSERYGMVIKTQNSWSGNFGLGGYCYLRKEHFSQINPDAFAYRYMNDPEGSESDIPVAI